MCAQKLIFFGAKSMDGLLICIAVKRCRFLLINESPFFLLVRTLLVLLVTLSACSSPKTEVLVEPLVVKKIVSFDIVGTAKQVREQIIKGDQAGLAASWDNLKAYPFQQQNENQDEAELKKVVDLIELISFNYFFPKDLQAFESQLLLRYPKSEAALMFHLKLLDRLNEFKELNKEIDSYNQVLSGNYNFQQFVIQTLINQGKGSIAEGKLQTQYYDRPKDKYFYLYMFLISLKADLGFKAKIILDKMKQTLPADSQTLYLEAQLLIYNKKYSDAKSALEKYKNLVPLDFEAKINFWTVLFMLNQKDAIISDLKDYKKFDQFPPSICLILAKLNVALKRFSEAKFLLNRLTLLSNNYAEGFLWRGVMFHDQDRQYARAIEDYDRFIKMVSPVKEHPVFIYKKEAENLLNSKGVSQ